MIAAQSGSGGAYRQLLGELANWLQRYYARRLPPAMIADAVQGALLAVHEKRHTYDPSKPFGPWLAAMARYKWIDRLRTMRADVIEELPNELAVGDHGDGIQNARSLESLFGQAEAGAGGGHSPGEASGTEHRGSRGKEWADCFTRQSQHP
jgi:DNA-directed RNA polymerase specialized sigma24 family protein